MGIYIWKYNKTWDFIKRELVYVFISWMRPIATILEIRYVDNNYSFYLNKRKFDIKKKIQISSKKKIQFLVTVCLKYHKYNVYSTLKAFFLYRSVFTQTPNVYAYKQKQLLYWLIVH